MIDPNSTSVFASEELETWAALATVLEWLPPALDSALGDAHGLTHFEYGILFALDDAPDGVLRMSTLAGYANSSLSRLSRAASRLEGRGWVQRSQDPSDGRSTLATLTGKGSEIVRRATPTHTQTVKDLILNPLTSAQKHQLRDISLRIQRAIREKEGWQPDTTDRRETS
ncbi:MarR family winged helix-turn-helix transcriptional regulator [Nesterenkonia halotolerans]|uniref:DNA-binding MarR family transcriptional regulator n=1 Tax=Nesterenkonia halotolerans TaxID=225325 RepID=A0ABR9J4A8_9MICC|nr:MarR family transcriptional regulator [Nesterenkonia halotolerans]MBE1513704.1 DNA-binding MarR family transcriptional regulator [Nesterenkonia halotolerans]